VNSLVPDVLDVGAMEPPVTVVGDVHLSASYPEVSERFARFLAASEGAGGTLVLLGDVFDYWVGRRQAREPFEGRFVEALARVARSGVALAFQAGNRDYAFDGADGLDVAIWPDVVVARWGEKRVAMTHGDLLCTGDGRYQAMRRVLRGTPGKTALKVLPHRTARWLARGLRDLSNREVRRKPYASMGIDYGLARSWLETLDADVLVAGHVHTGVHHRLGGPRTRDVYVLKDWERGGGVVRFDGRSIALARPR
jgi:UDP-2,3-diacylglucosamine hydrolase